MEEWDKKHGITPLMWAAAQGDEQAIALLLHYNANRNPVGCGKKPIDFARNDQIKELFEGAVSPKWLEPKEVG